MKIVLLLIIAIPSSSFAAVTQTAKLTASNGHTEDLPGWSTAVDGATIVAGAPRIVTEPRPGAAYVFERPASGWSTAQETAELFESDPAPSDQFGWSVGISGDTVVIGAFNNPKQEAYVYVKPSGGWMDMTETARLSVTETGSMSLGYSVAISGDTIVMYGSGSDYPNGAVYVFQKPAAGWTDMTQTAVLTGGKTQIDFGAAVAISGATVIAATAGVAPGGGAFVYREPAGGWQNTSTPDAVLTRKNGQAGDLLGYAVSIVGNTVALSTPAALRGLGLTAVYVEPLSGWSGIFGPTAELLSSTTNAGSNFGVSIAVYGPTILVGASAETVAGQGFAGAAYVYERPVTGWAPTLSPSLQLLPTDGGGDDQFGWSVALSKDEIVVGSFNDSFGGEHGRGALYVFEP